jgi:Anti-sigma-K factor rskA
MATEDHLWTGVHALDAFDDEAERREFADHLRGCDSCRAEARSLRQAAALLGGPVAVPVPAGLRDRVRAELARTPQIPPARSPLPAGDGPDGVAAHRFSRSGRPPLRWLAAAAAAVLALGGLAGYAGVQAHQAQLAAERADRSERDALLALGVLADPRARRVSARVAGGTATAVVAGGRAVLLADRLPALPADRIYQLWLVRPQQVISAGLGPAGGTAAASWGRLISDLRDGDSIALSVEPPGGSAQPTTTPVAVLKT